VRVVDLRVDPAGADRVAPDPLLRQVQRDPLGEPHDAVLRGRVDRQEGLADQAVHAGDVHDRAAAVRPHHRDRGQAAVHHALEVDREGAVDGLVGDRAQPLRGLLLADRPQRAGQVDAGVVDQDVERAPPVDRGLDGRFDLGALGHVHALGGRFTAGRDDPLGGLGGGALVDVDAQDAAALLAEPLGDGAPDAVAGPGDEAGLPGHASGRRTRPRNRHSPEPPVSTSRAER
jgi:hypothetical protein